MQHKVLIAGLLAVLASSSALAAKDNFDRASLGSKWIVTSPSLYITANQLQGDSLALGYLKKAASATSASASVILNGPDLQYGAVAVGDIASGNNAFVKLQAQDGSGTFSHGAFYVGNNGGGSFFTLDAPAASPATLSVTLSGTVATMTIKSSSGTQSYQYDYGASFGSGGGLGTYGPISLDNFKTKAPAAEAVTAPHVVTGSNARDLSR
jgi:hypothetical protein